MPCLTDGYPTPAEIAESKRRVEQRRAEQHIIKEEFEPMLCSACRVLERMGYDFDENPKLSVWWDKHKKEDAEKESVRQHEAQRKQYRERVMREALNKPIKDLSKEERTLLTEFGYL